MKRKVIISLVLGACLLLVLASPVLAGGLTVYGGKIETSVEPGGDYVYNIKVKNTSDGPMDIAVEVKGYGTSIGEALNVLEPEEDKSPYTARGLLTVSPTSFHLEPGDAQDIEVIAKIPAGIGEGGRYAIIFIHTAPQGEMVATVTAFAGRVLLTIADSNLTTDSEITEVTLAESESLAGVLVTVENNGNYHYKPQVQAKLIDGDKVVATASWSSNWPIIPGYSRQFKLNFVGEGSLSAGKYTVDIEVKDDSGKLVAGGAYPLKLAEEQEVLSPEQPSEMQAAPQSSQILPPGQPTPEKEALPSNYILIGGIIGGVIIVVLLVVICLLLKRRRAY